MTYVECASSCQDDRLASSLLSPLLGGISGSSSLSRLDAGELGMVKNSLEAVSNTDLL